MPDDQRLVKATKKLINYSQSIYFKHRLLFSLENPTVVNFDALKAYQFECWSEHWWIHQNRCQVAERLLIRVALSALTTSGIIMIVLGWIYEHRHPMVDQFLWDWVDQQRGKVKCEWDHHDHPRMNISASRRTSYVAGIIIII